MSIRDNKPSLAQRRLRLGWTQKRVGDEAGIDQATVSRAEHGRIASADIISAIDAALRRAEHRHDTVERGEADAFWQAARKCPHYAAVVGRIAAVATILLSGPLSDVELAERLRVSLPRDAMPESSR